MALLAWYKLDGNAEDSSGNGNHGIVKGSGSWEIGKINDSRHFTLDDSQIVIPHNELLSKKVFGYATVFSFSVWYYPTEWTSYGCLIQKAFGGSWSNTTAGIWVYSEGVRFVIGSNENSNPSGSSVGPVFKPSLNKWHHIAGVADGETLYLYVDGVLQGTSSISSVTRERTENTSSIVIGPRYENGQSKVRGYVDDLKIYDHALSTKEVKELAKAKVLHYTFSDFQEPTENFLLNGHFENGTGIPSESGSNAINDIVQISNPGDSEWALRQTDSDGGTVEYEVHFKDGTSIQPNTTYTLSCWVAYTSDWNGNDQVFHARYYRTDGTNWASNGAGELLKEIYINGLKWEYRKYTFTTDSLANGNFQWYVGYSGNNTIGYRYLTNLQIEAKSYATPFVDGVREGKVIDISSYDNHANLEMSNTPKWVEESKLGVGAYEFTPLDNSGANNGKTIMTNTISLPEDSFTFSFWTYRTASGYQGGSFFRFGGHGKAGIDTFDSSVRVYNSSGTQLASLSFNPNQNQWIHNVVVYDKTNLLLKKYTDGVLSSSVSVNQGVVSSSTHPLIIGHSYAGGINRFYNGIIDDFRIYATALSDEDIKELYQTRASLDDHGSLSSSVINETRVQPMLVNYHTWQVGTSGSQSGFGQNGSTSENSIIESVDPWGEVRPIWQAVPDSTSGADGGWVTGMFPIDNTQTYRYSVWVNRKVMGNGNFYLGCYGYDSTGGHIGVYDNANGTTNYTNPYFWSGTPPLESEWILVVGHIFPHNHTDTSMHSDSGMYTTNGGKIANTNRDYRWRSDNAQARHRTYLYYSTDINTRQQWCYPKVEVCDGTEPTINELLSGHDSRNFNYTSSINVLDKKPFQPTHKGISHMSNISELGPINDIQAWYPLNGDANDRSGNLNHGTVTGATAVPGLEGLAYQFTAETDNIYLGDHILNKVSGSLSFWINFASTVSQDIFGYASDTGYTNMIEFRGSYFYAETNNNCGWFHSPTLNPVNANEWHHFSVVFENSRCYWYQNGVYIGETSDYGTINCDSNQPITELYDNFRFRYIGGGGYSANFLGKIQDVRIYNRALSPEEVGILYSLTGGSNDKMKVTKDKIYLKGQIKEV